MVIFLLRAKKRFVEVLDKLCQLKKTSKKSITCFRVDQPYHFNGNSCLLFLLAIIFVPTTFCQGTAFEKINRKVENLVNERKDFPDCQDLFELVQTCNVEFYGGVLG